MQDDPKMTGSALGDTGAGAQKVDGDILISVFLTALRWKRIVACLDWHGKDHESELIVDAIREQIGDEQS